MARTTLRALTGIGLRDFTADKRRATALPYPDAKPSEWVHPSRTLQPGETFTVDDLAATAAEAGQEIDAAAEAKDLVDLGAAEWID